MKDTAEIILNKIRINRHLNNRQIAKQLIVEYPQQFKGKILDSVRRRVSMLRKRNKLGASVGHASTKQLPLNARILLIDIETAPILASVWQLWDQNVGLSQIKCDTHLLAFAAKWLGAKNTDIIYDDQSHAKRLEDDTRLLKRIWHLLDEADVVIAHNGQAFDVPRIQARMVLAGFRPPSPFRHVDTLREARKHFAFTSNKLEYLADKLGVPKLNHGAFPGFELWKECLAGNALAWREMKKYNVQDVLALEILYLKLRPWIVGHPNLGMYVDSSEPVCPKCGGHVHHKGERVTNFGRYKRYLCMSCNGWSRGRTLTNSITERRRQLAN